MNREERLLTVLTNIRDWLQKPSNPDCPEELERAEKYIAETLLPRIDDALALPMTPEAATQHHNHCWEAKSKLRSDADKMAAETSERQRFEAWWLNKNPDSQFNDLVREGWGYKKAWLDDCWQAWQSSAEFAAIRASQTTAAADEIVEACAKLLLDERTRSAGTGKDWFDVGLTHGAQIIRERLRGTFALRARLTGEDIKKADGQPWRTSDKWAEEMATALNAIIDAKEGAADVPADTPRAAWERAINEAKQRVLSLSWIILGLRHDINRNLDILRGAYKPPAPPRCRRPTSWS